MNRLKHGFSSHVGNVRSHNEDCFAVEPELGLWVVADGMGGHKGGETASAIAVEFIVDNVRKGNSLEKSISRAHHVIKEESQKGRGPEGMGTTIVAMRTSDNNYEIAWVGDCRAYLWDGINLFQLTKDHSYVQHLVETGVISPGESENHPYQDILMQALGAKDTIDVNVGLLSGEWHQNEQILLCSDGLTKELNNSDIASVLSLEINEQEKVNSMIDMALKNGGKDNITAMVISAAEDAPAKQPEEDTVQIQTTQLNAVHNNLIGKIVARLKGYLRLFIKTDNN
jgi:serine/threonine protein phosphatase PrpC